MNGWLVIDKPVGIGSTQVVGAVKRALREGGYAKAKVGHGGTLDPLASGVLPVAIGEATKLAGRMLEATKAYEFTITFGSETDTLDLEGVEIATSEVRATLAEVEAMLLRFTGPIEQVPPAYSALKIDGKAAYARARAGETVEMQAREVTVHSLKRKEEDPHPNLLPRAGEGVLLPSPACGRGQGEGLLPSVTLTATVSKGTYIRSLARDIAHTLGTVGHVSMLRRTKAGPFTVERAISLDKLGEAAKARTLEEYLLPLTAGLDDIPALPVSPDQAGALRQGRIVIGIAAQPGLYLATDQDVPVALVEAGEDGLRVVRGFNL